MKAGWATKTLGEVLQQTETVNPTQNPDAEFDYVDVSSVSNQTFRIGETQRLKGKEAPSRARKLVKTNDVLFATVRPTLRRIAVVPAELDHQVCSTGYFVLRPKPGLYYRFVYYFLLSEDFIGRMEVLQKGASYPAVTDGEVRAQSIPIPPLPEQHRIVTILDEAFDDIAKAKSNTEKILQSSQALFDGYLESMFSQRSDGWVERKVSEIAKHSLGKMLDKARNRGEAHPYLRNINVRWFDIDLSDLLEMRFLPEESEKYMAVKGDVLICEGGYPGRAAIWNNSYPIHFQKALHRVRFHEPEYSKWFVYFLYFLDRTGGLRSHFTGTGIQHFTGEALGRLLVPVPPITETIRILEKFESISAEIQRLEAIYRQKLVALETLKKAFLRLAFGGELDTQDPNDEPASISMEQPESERDDMGKSETIQRPFTNKRPIANRSASKIGGTMLKRKDVAQTHLTDLLKEKGQLTPEALLEASQLEIDDFYDQLKAEEESSNLVEVVSGPHAANRVLKAER